jgi:peptidoglycan/LPS O-acetylase OafA/YrhL
VDEYHRQLAYRADIDYLRAIAVLAVVGFHYGIPGFSGGFVGVDVFFVISGYLITRIILENISKETFSFRWFYERRARRLLPALYAMILATGIVAWFVAPPDDYRTFFGSAISAVLFSANFFFWLNSGYFELPTIGKALIHTWSLSVEEQFYFVFPLSIWLASRRFDRNPAIVAATIILIICALCALDEFQLKRSPPAAFHLRL